MENGAFEQGYAPRVILVRVQRERAKPGASTASVAAAVAAAGAPRSCHSAASMACPASTADWWRRLYWQPRGCRTGAAVCKLQGKPGYRPHNHAPNCLRPLWEAGRHPGAAQAHTPSVRLLVTSNECQHANELQDICGARMRPGARTVSWCRLRSMWSVNAPQTHSNTSPAGPCLPAAGRRTGPAGPLRFHQKPRSSAGGRSRPAEAGQGRHPGSRPAAGGQLQG